MTTSTSRTGDLAARDVRLSNVPTGGTLLSVTVTLTQGAHEQAVLTISSPRTVSYNSAQGQMIQFHWGNSEFFGYVTDVTTLRETRVRPNPIVQISAMGATFVMKTGRPRFFTEVTVAEVAKRLATEHKLGFSDEYGKEHYRWRQLAQTDESDWEFLNMLAVRVGADLVCSAGVLRLIDPMSVISRTEPLLLFSTTEDDGNPDLYDFVPAHYSDRLPSQFAPTVSYLVNGKVATLTQNSPVQLPTVFSAERPLLNQKEAVLAQIRMPVNWEEQAVVRVQGNSRIEPGIVLLLKSSAKSVNVVAYDGYWYVIGVTHSMSKGVFQSRADLARITKAPRLPGVSAKQWHLDERGRPQLVPTATGVWASTWR